MEERERVEGIKSEVIGKERGGGRREEERAVIRERGGKDLLSGRKRSEKRD